MDEQQYKENARKIIELACGMTESQWYKISAIIAKVFEKKKAEITFEKPGNLDLLMKQHRFIE